MLWISADWKLVFFSALALLYIRKKKKLLLPSKSDISAERISPLLLSNSTTNYIVAHLFSFKLNLQTSFLSRIVKKDRTRLALLLLAHCWGTFSRKSHALQILLSSRGTIEEESPPHCNRITSLLAWNFWEKLLCFHGPFPLLYVNTVSDSNVEEAEGIASVGCASISFHSTDFRKQMEMEKYQSLGRSLSSFPHLSICFHFLQIQFLPGRGNKEPLSGPSCLSLFYLILIQKRTIPILFFFFFFPIFWNGIRSAIWIGTLFLLLWIFPDLKGICSSSLGEAWS